MNKTNLTELFTNLHESIMLGLIRPSEGTNRAIDAICATDKERKFPIDEIREYLADYPLLIIGLEEVIK